MPQAEKYTSDNVGIGINVRMMEVFQQMSYFRHYLTFLVAICSFSEVYHYQFLLIKSPNAHDFQNDIIYRIQSDYLF